MGEAATPLSVGAMASEVGVSRVTLAKHIREGHVTADARVDIDITDVGSTVIKRERAKFC
jgi:hypothetical protein